MISQKKHSLNRASHVYLCNDFVSFEENLLPLLVFKRFFLSYVLSIRRWKSFLPGEKTCTLTPLHLIKQTRGCLGWRAGGAGFCSGFYCISLCSISLPMPALMMGTTFFTRTSSGQIKTFREVSYFFFSRRRFCLCFRATNLLHRNRKDFSFLLFLFFSNCHCRSFQRGKLNFLHASSQSISHIYLETFRCLINYRDCYIETTAIRLVNNYHLQFDLLIRNYRILHFMTLCKICYFLACS